MRRSASEVIRNLEMRIARLERQSFDNMGFGWSEEAFSTLVMGRTVEDRNGGYSATVEDDNGIRMFTMTLTYSGGGEKVSWKSGKMTKYDIQEWGEALKKELRAGSPVEAWVAIIEGANEGDRLSSDVVIRRAINSLR